MSLVFTDYLLIGLYFLILIGISIHTRGMKTFKEFSVGNREIPFPLLFASIAATYIGPGACMGMVGKGFESGFMFYLLVLSFPLQFVITGLVIAPRLTKYTDCESIGDIFAKKHGDFSKLLSGIVSVGLCLGFVALMAKVGGGMLSSFTGIDFTLSVIIMSGITTLYVFTGGLKASITTDTMQFSVFAIIIPLVFIFSLMRPEIQNNNIFSDTINLTRNSLQNLGLLGSIGLVLAFFFGEMLVPPYVSRALSAKSSKDSTKGFLYAGLFGFFWFAIIFGIGIFSKSIIPLNTNPDQVFLILSKEVLPAGLYGLMLVALLGIIMSTQDSMINTGSTTIVKDILFFFNLSEDQKLTWGRVSTVILAIIAAILALYLPSIIDSVLILYSIWAPTIVLPLLLVIFLKRVNKIGIPLSIIAGGLSTFIWTKFESPIGIPPVIVGLIFCILFYFIGDLFNKKEK